MRHFGNPEHDSWPSFSTRRCVVSRAEAWLRSECDKALCEWHGAGGSAARPAMYRCQGLPQGWDSEGSDSKASSTWAHAHGRSVYKHYPGIPRPEREVRCYVTSSKRIASLPASRRAAAPTLGQPAWKLWRQSRYEKLRVRKEEIKSSSHNSVCAREVGETESMGTLLLQRIAQRQAFIVQVRRLNWLFNFSVQLEEPTWARKLII